MTFVHVGDDHFNLDHVVRITHDAQAKVLHIQQTVAGSDFKITDADNHAQYDDMLAWLKKNSTETHHHGHEHAKDKK